MNYFRNKSIPKSFHLIFGTNASIFLYLNLMEDTQKKYKKHFLLNIENLKENRYYTLITSSFTHSIN